MLSVFKYFVALKVLDKLEKEKISLNKDFPFKISISNLHKYMISQSDNNACDILIDYAGGTKEIQKYIRSIGFADIEISQTGLI